MSQVHFWGRKELVILLPDVNTRVTGAGVDDKRSGGGEALCVLVEDDVALILDELFLHSQQRGRSIRKEKKYLALLVDTVNLTPSGIASMQLDAGACETSPQGVGGFPGMIMRDLAVNVVGNVSLRDAMGAGGSDPGHDGSEVTKEVTIVRRQGTTGESELASTIVREEGVGVLQESDHHEPVVDPRNEISPETPPDKIHATYQR